MDVNAQFNVRTVVHTATNPWVPSPIPGVERRMLDRLGDEVARATTIVRFAPGSSFPAHTHGGGEEFVVLDGVFEDEFGKYPIGSYIRNPPESRHRPSSPQGATILVKLWQFDPTDRQTVRLHTDGVTPEPVDGRDGVTSSSLYKDAHETVRIEHWKAGARVAIAGHQGLEVFVIDGGFAEAGEDFERHSWLRLPPGQKFKALAGPNGTRVWIKSGHLSTPPKRPSA